MSREASETRRARLTLGIGAAVVAGGGLALWRYSPLADLVTSDRLASWLGAFGESAWAPAIVVGLYVLGGFVVFPLLVLIGATAVIFEPATALAVSFAGSLANALAIYLTGAMLTRRTVQAALGGALDRIKGALENRSILAVAVVRSVPVAPFTVVNLAAGSIGVPLKEYLIGTALGLAPGITLMTAFGNRLRSLWQDPTPANVAILAGIIAAWFAMAFALQRLATRLRRRSGPATSSS